MKYDPFLLEKTRHGDKPLVAEYTEVREKDFPKGYLICSATWLGDGVLFGKFPDPNEKTGWLYTTVGSYQQILHWALNHLLRPEKPLSIKVGDVFGNRKVLAISDNGKLLVYGTDKKTYAMSFEAFYRWALKYHHKHD